MKHLNASQITLSGVSIVTNNQDGKAGIDLPILWEKFMGITKENSLIPLDGNVYCVYCDYEGNYMAPYRAFIGCKLENTIESMETRTFPIGRHQRFDVKGDLMKGVIFEQWQNIWKMPLNRNYIADFEVYPAEIKDPKNAEASIYVGIV